MTSINLNDFRKQNCIGSGAYSKVYKIIEKNTNEVFAAKVLFEEFDENSSEKFTTLSQEVNITAGLDHPSILRFKGFSPIDFKKRPRPVIITEYASNGTLEDHLLKDRLQSGSYLNDTQKLIIIYGIASAMSYFHANNILHRDLKPENILVDDFLFPKIADFGLSKVKLIQSDILGTAKGIYKGTPLYMSPEIWDRSEYSRFSDVYAFSFIVYEIMANKRPYDDLDDYKIMLKIGNRERPKFTTTIPESYQKLITACWAENPLNRPTFVSITEQLKTDRSFITENVNETEFFNYINYIEKYGASFDKSKSINCLDLLKKMTKVETMGINNVKEYISISNNLLIERNSTLSTFLSLKDFTELEKICKDVIANAGKDPSQQFRIAKYFIEGQFFYKRNAMVGIKYLIESMNSGNIESAIYYCKMLIKGDRIPCNIKKAKKILEQKIKEKDPGEYYNLYGKISKKEKKYAESLKLFEKSISFNNYDSLYEYGKLLIKDKYCISNKEEGIQYIQKAIEKNYPKAMYKYGYLLVLGKEIPKNLELGVQYIEKAAEEGYVDAIYQCTFLSYISNDLYLKYLTYAAYHGHIDAMYKYASLISDLKDKRKESLIIFKNASDAGHFDSMYSYAKLIHNGVESGTKDPITYAQYMRILAYNGNSDGMLEYANLLSKGEGVVINKEEALKFYKMATDKGNHESMFYYALMLDIGDGVLSNKKEAIKYYKILANEGNTTAMYNYANMLNFGDGIPENKEEAIKYYKMAIDKGHVRSMYNYAGLVESGDGITENKEEAVKYFKIAADKGHVKSMYNYAVMVENGSGIQENKKEAIKYYKMAADNGDSQAMFVYATMVDVGNGIPINKEEAVKYYKMAADGGNSRAMFNYAIMLITGDSVPINKEEAFMYLKMADDLGNQKAIYGIARMLDDGIGIPVNKNEAIKYYKKAADKGDLRSMVHYGIILLKGDGIPVNEEEAARYFKMAAEEGILEAMFNYANMKYRGIGVPVNKEEAVIYYKMAADIGHVESMVCYSTIMYKGDIVPVNKEEAAKYIKMAADNGDREAMMTYSMLLAKGDGVTANNEEAVEYYLMATLI